jgi:Rod binding domain-containing protein
MAQAKEFESVFVAQMLKHSGFEKALSGNSGFGGESYASLLLEQYAARMTERGGFGLAEKIYDQLIDRESENGPK